MALPETTQEWIERYQKRYDRAFQNYQESGDPKYDRQSFEYGKIVDAFLALEKKEDEYHNTISKRTKNFQYVVDRLYKDEYTKAEVIDLLRNAIYW